MQTKSDEEIHCFHYFEFIHNFKYKSLRALPVFWWLLLMIKLDFLENTLVWLESTTIVFISILNFELLNELLKF